MNSATSTLYWRIVGLYLLLLLAFSSVATLLAAKQFEGFLGEVEQRLNRSLAVHLAHELAPALNAQDRDAVNQSVRRIAGINPSIDIYILSSDGLVITSFTGKPVLRHQVDIDPVRRFLAKDASLPIRATDPGDPKADKVFSAAVMPATPAGGYLYAILPGMPFETAAHMVRTSYVLRGAASVLAAVLLATFLAGLLFFYILTRRFQRLTLTVKRFQEGAFHERADVSPKDQIGRLAATFNDMAATIESQFEALRQTDEARRALASNIAHDFRTPLTAIRGYADRLSRADDRLSLSERREHLSVILKSAGQLEHLANQLAIMVQLDGSGDYVLKLESFSIAELVQDAVVKFAPVAQEEGVRLMLLNPQNVPPIMGDIALLERAIANLIDNALKSTGRDGHVSITLPVSESHVTFRIEDSGCGIDADEIPLITHRFFRTARSRSLKLEGSGLGLAIVDEILKMHGTKLHIESRIDMGTVFSFALRVS
jgi:two-component system OmpR family sensor kinase